MVNRIIIFKGSKRDFDFLLKQLVRNNSYTPFMELIQTYNARLRPNESGVKETELGRKINIEFCVVKADDYASVLPHVLSNFSNIVTLNSNINCLIVHNPPRRVEDSLRTYDTSIIEYQYSQYEDLSKNKLKEIYEELNQDVLGQVQCKKSMISGLYKLYKEQNDKPVVLMFYGPSGVGKTESAKSISRALGGDLLRIQFSMMQSNEAFNYVFGSEHSNSSLAKDMLSRESNVILIDEFDKVDPRFYNAFYELFDEGKYKDTNYEVDLRQSIFICTANFMDEDIIKKTLGPAMFSRFSELIKFEELEKMQKLAVLNKWYKEILEKLDNEEKQIIKTSTILEWFRENVERYNNIRIMKTKLENAIFRKLTERYIF